MESMKTTEVVQSLVGQVREQGSVTLTLTRREALKIRARVYGLKRINRLLNRDAFDDITSHLTEAGITFERQDELLRKVTKEMEGASNAQGTQAA